METLFEITLSSKSQHHELLKNSYYEDIFRHLTEHNQAVEEIGIEKGMEKGFGYLRSKSLIKS